MTEHDFTLMDRIQKIQSTIRQHGEENFYISFSGGKDSTVLHRLIDVAMPGNRIPRVFADTGIEFRAIRNFVEREREKDDRIQLIKPSVPVKKMLEEHGYPFKSKQHSKWLDTYQRNGMTWSIKNYIGEGEKTLYRPCPKKLKYQFDESFPLRISDKCCTYMKEKPITGWAKKNNRRIGISGILREEGGRRMHAKCVVETAGKVRSFHPLAVVTKTWEEWFINAFNVELCELYYPPFNFERTGCKGCPFALHLQQELDTLEELLPNERKQCEVLWKPVYDEYRRIGYRLKPREDFEQMTLEGT